MSEELNLLTFCKHKLRITSEAFDDELNVLIEAAKKDINQATDKDFDIADEVQCVLVSVYVKAYFGAGDEKAQAAYQSMLQADGLRKVKNIDEVTP